MKYILMCCLMALGSTGWAQAEPFTGKIFKTKGSVECMKKGAPGWKKVKAPYMLDEGDQVKTGPGAMAELYIKYGSKIRLGADTAFNVTTVSPEGNAVEVLRGKMFAWIRKFTGRKFSVRTPAAVCAVRGTEFGVEVEPDGDAVWDLFTGSVQISDNLAHVVDMQPHQRLQVSGAEGITAPPAAIPAGVKPPDEPAKIKEEKVEIKSEKSAMKAQAAVGTVKEEKGLVPPVPVDEPVDVQEPVTSVIPTQVVEESEELSDSTP